jgi:hypothetical protein
LGEKTKPTTNISYEILSWIGWAALAVGAAIVVSSLNIADMTNVPMGAVAAVVGVIIVVIAMYLKRSLKGSGK